MADRFVSGGAVEEATMQRDERNLKTLVKNLAEKGNALSQTLNALFSMLCRERLGWIISCAATSFL